MTTVEIPSKKRLHWPLTYRHGANHCSTIQLHTKFVWGLFVGCGLFGCFVFPKYFKVQWFPSLSWFLWYLLLLVLRFKVPFLALKLPPSALATGQCCPPAITHTHAFGKLFWECLMAALMHLRASKHLLKIRS